jgi:DNA-3-methyladenine glycosylase
VLGFQNGSRESLFAAALFRPRLTGEKRDSGVTRDSREKPGGTEIIVPRGGSAYVYMCYGIHFLLNVVTEKEISRRRCFIRACEGLEGGRP